MTSMDPTYSESGVTIVFIGTFFPDSDYGGTGLTMNTTDTTLPNLLLSYPPMYNKISSLKIANGFLVFVYTGINYTGTSWVFRGPIDVPNLDDYGINDAIESIQAIPISSGTAGVTLFQNSNQGGVSNYFPTGTWNLADYPIGEKTASSVTIFGLTEAQINNSDSTDAYGFSNSTTTPINTNIPSSYNDTAVHLIVDSY